VRQVADATVAAGGAAGYSGTPLARKLGIAEGSAVVLVNAPEGFEEVLAAPAGADVRRRLPATGRRAVDVAVLFTAARADLDRRFPRVAASVRPAAGLWVAWPKRSSGVPTDLTENVVREVGVANGMVDNKVCAVTEVWSGLRFVYRLEDRPRIEAGG
jgi:hypothetical protein